MYPLSAPDAADSAFVPAAYRIKLVTEDWERRAAMALRRAVFCGEQRLFVSDDRDEIDTHAQTLVAVSCVAGMSEAVVGTVRIHRSTVDDTAGVWFGSRLAVQREYRSLAWLGSELIQLAVSTANAQGCTRFLAQVQLRNVKLFQHLHWQSLEETMLHSRPHHLMQADLAHYPACHDGERGFYTVLRQVA